MIGKEIDDNIAHKIAAMQLNGISEDIFILLDLVSSTHINNLRAAIMKTFFASEQARKEFEEFGVDFSTVLEGWDGN